jgi:hypothetical protein
MGLRPRLADRAAGRDRPDNSLGPARAAGWLRRSEGKACGGLSLRGARTDPLAWQKINVLAYQSIVD